MGSSTSQDAKDWRLLEYVPTKELISHMLVCWRSQLEEDWELVSGKWKRESCFLKTVKQSWERENVFWLQRRHRIGIALEKWWFLFIDWKSLFIDDEAKIVAKILYDLIMTERYSFNLQESFSFHFEIVSQLLVTLLIFFLFHKLWDSDH